MSFSAKTVLFMSSFSSHIILGSFLKLLRVARKTIQHVQIYWRALLDKDLDEIGYAR